MLRVSNSITQNSDNYLRTQRTTEFGTTIDANSGVSIIVYDALRTMSIDLRRIQYVHNDRGSEFNAKLLDAVWKAFGIQQSLSRKGCPYDNAVSESTFHIVKTEFIRNRSFESLQQLRQELSDVYWYNTIRIHGSLNYQTPATVRQSPL